MDGNDTPGALDAELLEVGGCHDAVGCDEGVGVEKGTPDDANYNNREAAAEDLGSPAADCATG